MVVKCTCGGDARKQRGCPIPTVKRDWQYRRHACEGAGGKAHNIRPIAQICGAQRRQCTALSLPACVVVVFISGASILCDATNIRGLPSSCSGPVARFDALVGGRVVICAVLWTIRASDD
jgi:hypothetical protein